MPEISRFELLHFEKANTNINENERPVNGVRAWGHRRNYKSFRNLSESLFDAVNTMMGSYEAEFHVILGKVVHRIGKNG